MLKSLDKIGFVNPTPIQAQSIPHLLHNENDLIGLAQTGTGKTAAFSLPILQQIDTKDNRVQALILSPTRELCLQICRDIETFSDKQKVKTLAVYGGSNIREQIKALKSGVHLVVGTPGRTLDLIERKRLVVQDIQYLVLDEADEMLSMGFQESLDQILATTPDEKQTILFSATMPKEIRKISKKYMNDPYEISVISETKTTSNVDHEYYITSEKNRYAALKRLADYNHNMYGIVFCRTRRETQKVADKLMQDGYNSDSLHGDLSQAQRDKVMDRFRNKNLQMLVATDVAARGIDVNDLTHVINYNLPDSLETYVHRSGRTGRANNRGICITIISKKEGGRIRRLEQMLERSFSLKRIPEGKEIYKNKLGQHIDRFLDVKFDKAEMQDMLDEIYLRLEAYSKEEVVDRFVAIEFNRYFDYYKNSGDLNESEDRSGKRSGDGKSKRRKGKREGNFSRFFVTAGKEHKVNKGELLTFINQSLPGKRLDIGDLEIKKSFSYFEIEAGHEELVLDNMNGVKFRGKKIKVELAKPEKGRGSRSHKRKSKSNKRRHKRK